MNNLVLNYIVTVTLATFTLAVTTGALLNYVLGGN